MDIPQLLNKEMELPSIGFVYACRSAAFPNRIKIGKTNNVKARLSQLNVGCAPSPHVMIATAATFDSTRDEKMAHVFFSNSRKEGEFFNINDDDVKKFFEVHIVAQHAEEMRNYINAYCSYQVDIPMVADPVALVPKKKEVSVVGSFLTALVKQNYAGMPLRQPWKNITMTNGVLYVTCKLLCKAFMDYNASGDVKAEYTEMWFFNNLRRFNGFTSQRTNAFRYYKINICELETGLKDAGEYDEEAEPLEWPIAMDVE